MLHIALGPSSQKTVTDSLMSATAELARRHEGVRLHTHLAENREDITLMAKVYGEGHKFGDYIKSVGWDKVSCATTMSLFVNNPLQHAWICSMPSD
jgi:hypothetical protein